MTVTHLYRTLELPQPIPSRLYSPIMSNCYTICYATNKSPQRTLKLTQPSSQVGCRQWKNKAHLVHGDDSKPPSAADTAHCL